MNEVTKEVMVFYRKDDKSLGIFSVPDVEISTAIDMVKAETKAERAMALILGGKK